MDTNSRIRGEIDRIKNAIVYYATLLGVGLFIILMLAVPVVYGDSNNLLYMGIIGLFMVLPAYLLKTYEEYRLKKIRKQYERRLNYHQKFQRRMKLGLFIDICIVCDLPMYSSEASIECPICHARAHETHLLEWVKVKGNCPKCKTHLSDTDFINLDNYMVPIQ